jgi:hypothetical protein
MAECGSEQGRITSSSSHKTFESDGMAAAAATRSCGCCRRDLPQRGVHTQGIPPVQPATGSLVNMQKVRGTSLSTSFSNLCFVHSTCVLLLFCIAPCINVVGNLECARSSPETALDPTCAYFAGCGRTSEEVCRMNLHPKAVCDGAPKPSRASTVYC